MKKKYVKSVAMISWMRWPLLVLAGLVLTGCGKEASEPDVLSHTAHQVIVPLYAELDSQAKQQLEAGKAFCSETNLEQLELLQDQWRSTMSAWAHVQPIGFGPIEDGNLRWKLQFWPDRKDITRKKIEALIGSDEELNAERVAAASVSVQGLAALEYLLFDNKGGDPSLYQQQPRRCQLLISISERIEQVTLQLLNEWRGELNETGYADKFALPGENNPLYPDTQAALADLLETLVVGAEVVKRNKLGLPIANGKAAKSAKPYRLEAWRSQYSLELMRASTAALEQLYRGTDDFGLSAYLAQQVTVKRTDLNAIDEAFKAVNAQFDLLEGPLFTQLKQPDYYAQLVELHKHLATLQQTLGKLPDSLGISLGFNSNDGD